MKLKETLTLGQLITALEKQPPQNNVRFDFCGFVPTTLDSWRGRYQDLAVGFDANTSKTVEQFLAECKEAIGKQFIGYKGGEYIMRESTPVYVELYGMYHSPTTGITKVVGDEYDTILKTSICD